MKLLEYAEKVSKHAYRVVERDFSTFRDSGWSEKQILEATAVVAHIYSPRGLIFAIGEAQPVRMPGAAA